MGDVTKWVLGIVSLVALTSGIIISINKEKERQRYEKTHYKCEYKPGMCKKRPTWKNCSGGLLDSECERILNDG